MKLVVLVPSEEYRGYAGSRIRYDRIQPSLEQQGIILSVESIDAFDPKMSGCDVLLISKCHDARSLIIAAYLKSRGVLVGPDLFDDYFSDATDARLIAYRGWLGQLAHVSDFALCSTQAMSDVISNNHGNLPIHVMNDPGEPFDSERLKGELDRKLSEALADNLLRVGWYGVGDNAFFPVGLEDLAAFGDRLNELAQSPLKVRLTVLTNKRALSAARLNMIARLPVQTEVTEWSEDAERQLLTDSFVVFLPVSSQPFSRAKSLNRAVTALSAGCQVLSVGYPLYDSLAPFVYRDPTELCPDLEHRRLKFSPQSLADYQATISALGSPETEARNLSQFLSSFRSRRTGTSSQIRVIHGTSTREEVHRLIKSVGGLSVASPYTRARFKFDVRFRGPPSQLELSLSEEASARMQTFREGQLSRPSLQRTGLRLQIEALRRRLRAAQPASQETAQSDALILATYQETMSRIAGTLDEMFGPGPTIVCEYSRLPVPRAVLAA